MEYPQNILKHSKTISEGLEGFGISKGECVPCGMGFLWDLWYNKDWLETTRTRFLGVLKELLIDKTLPENLKTPSKDCLQSLRRVWSAWNEFSSKSKIKSELLLQKVNKQRYNLRRK